MIFSVNKQQWKTKDMFGMTFENWKTNFGVKKLLWACLHKFLEVFYVMNNAECTSSGWHHCVHSIGIQKVVGEKVCFFLTIQWYVVTWYNINKYVKDNVHVTWLFYYYNNT